MRFFCFKLIKAEYDLRKKIDGLISSDEPDIDIFGIKRWNKGLHFTGNDVYIDGFYLNEYWNKVRGFPVRSRFRGRFTVNNSGSMEFRGWLYPAFPEFTFLVCLFLLQLISGFYSGAFIIAVLSGFGYTRLFEDNAIALKNFLNLQ